MYQIRALLPLSLLSMALACEGPIGPQGPPGEMGKMGLPGMGWNQVGNDLVSTNGVNVGVSTVQKARATLDVNGSLYVNEDLSLLPEQSCHNLTFDSSNSSTDLGDLLADPLKKYRCVSVLLAASTTWTWNKPIAVRNFQRLAIIGDGGANFAQNLTVVINMTQNDTFSGAGSAQREPTRVLVGSHASFALASVKLFESANDARPLSSLPGGALFVMRDSRQFGVIELTNIRISTSEDVVGIGERVTATVLFGHTFIDKAPGAPRDIKALKSYTGWGFPGNYTMAHTSINTLGAGVSFDTNPKIIYTN